MLTRHRSSECRNQHLTLAPILLYITTIPYFSNLHTLCTFVVFPYRSLVDFLSQIAFPPLLGSRGISDRYIMRLNPVKIRKPRTSATRHRSSESRNQYLHPVFLRSPSSLHVFGISLLISHQFPPSNRLLSLVHTVFLIDT